MELERRGVKRGVQNRKECVQPLVAADAEMMQTRCTYGFDDGARITTYAYAMR